MGDPRDAEDGDAPYRVAFDPDTSYGSAVRLLTESGSPGLLLDIGCGYGAIEGPLRVAGWSYLGVDNDPRAVRALTERGIEAVQLDLDVDVAQLTRLLRDLIGDRPLRAIAALDVLEHLRDPGGCLGALAVLAEGHGGADLVVSLPNVTHIDVAAKLLAGRWDEMSTGLLDRTHRHFFDERSAEAMWAAHGWHEVAADDVLAFVSEQAQPADLPTVRPDAPLNDLLRTVRGRAGHGGATTFQFVRRLRLGPATVPGVLTPPCAVTVVVLPGRSNLDAVAEQLAAQTERDFEVILCSPDGDLDETGFADRAGVTASRVSVVQDLPDLDRRAASGNGRYLCAVAPDESVDAAWLSSFVSRFDLAPGRVLVARSGDPVGDEVPVARFDFVGSRPTGMVVSSAYAVPRAALEVGVATLQGGLAERAASLARSSLWCGRHDLDDRVCTSGEPTPLSALMAEVGALLDLEPLLLAKGAVRPLLAVHEQIAAEGAARHRAEGETQTVAAELARQQAYHVSYARSVETTLDELRAELVRSQTLPVCVKAQLRRVAGGLSRRARRLKR